MKKLYILILFVLPFGLFLNRFEYNQYNILRTENVNETVIKNIIYVIDSTFGYTNSKIYDITFTDDLLSDDKKSYDGSKVISKYYMTEKTLIITNNKITDICHGKRIILSGWTQRNGYISILSTYKLDSVNFISRMKKLTVHEFSHYFGLNHCDNPICIMNEESKLDEQLLWYCKRCQNQINLSK